MISALTQYENKTLDSFICEINQDSEIIQQYALEAAQLLNATHDRLSEYQNSGFLQRIWNAISGKNAQMTRANQVDLIKIQRYAFFFLQKVQKQNLLLAKTVTLINSELKTVRSELFNLQNMIGQVDKNKTEEIQALQEYLEKTLCICKQLHNRVSALEGRNESTDFGSDSQDCTEDKNSSANEIERGVIVAKIQNGVMISQFSEFDTESILLPDEAWILIDDETFEIEASLFGENWESVCIGDYVELKDNTLVLMEEENNERKQKFREICSKKTCQGSTRIIDGEVFVFLDDGILGSLSKENMHPVVPFPEGCFCFIECNILSFDIQRNRIELSADFSSVEIPNGVTEIKPKAFQNSINLVSVKIPNTITKIGGEAFDGCKSLTSIEIPRSVTEVGDSAFSECFCLSSVVIPDSVTQIGEGAFYRCDMESIKIPPRLSKISESVFRECEKLTSVVIPNGVTEIQDCAFAGCINLTSVEIPDSVETIGFAAFRDCAKLTSIKLPFKLKEIAEELFYGCSSLKDVDLPDNVTQINWDSFKDCISLHSIKLPNSLKKISPGAFQGCKNLNGIVFPNSAIEFGGGCFSGCKDIIKGGKLICLKNTTGNVKIPYGITEIQDCAFADCSDLTSVEIPNSVTKIGSQAFSGCTNLTAIEIPDSVVEIGTDAFEGCPNIKFDKNFENRKKKKQ